MNTGWFEEMRGCYDVELLPTAAADSAVSGSNCHPSILDRSQSIWRINEAVCVVAGVCLCVCIDRERVLKTMTL